MRVHQLCARLQHGDAITNHVLALHRLFRKKGWESHIYAHFHDAVHAGINEGEKEYAREYLQAGEDLLIYHYSVYDENYRLYLKSRNRKILVYHNITPPEFFEPYQPELAAICRRGRELLPRLRRCDFAWGDSEYNRVELVEAGFDPESTGVLPIIVDRGRLEEENRPLTEELRDGTTNLLFVGRWVPNKRIEDLLRVFAFYHHKLNANSRLLVVGSSWLPNYNRELLGEIRRLGLSGKVLFPGGGRGVSDPDLVSYYRSADAFVIMSEHEGFCVPLVESMFFGVPIFAYAAGAVPETLGGSGVLVSRKVFPVIALAIEEVLENRVLRSAVVGKEKERLEDLSQGRIEERLWEYLQPFL